MSAVAYIRSSFKEYFYEDTELQYLYEDEQCVAFDIIRNIQAPTHFLVVPKKIIPSLSLVCPEDEKLLGHLLVVAKNVAIQKGLPAGYHVVVDEDYRTKKFKAIHIFGRALHHMVWPIGPGCRL